MSVRGSDKYVASPTDVRGAGYDEWASMTGIPHTSPLLGGAGFAGYAGTGGVGELGSFTDIVSGNEGTVAMPGGAPAAGPARARWNDWRELFDPHSPMLWLLLFTLFATSLVHLRVHAGIGH
jgi:hypothetical protein